MYKKIIEGKKAVFFDLDGTVAQTEAFWLKAIETVFYTIHKDISDKARNIISLSGLDVKAKWKRLIDLDLIETKKPPEELAEDTQKEFVKLLEEYELELTEGFWQLAYELKVNREFKLVLTTNTKKSIAEIVLNKLDISKTFDFLIFGDEVKNPKPNPEIYNKALELIKLSAAEIIVFEDSPAGVQAALSAKLDVVVIWSGFVSKSLYPKSAQILEFFSDFTPLPANLEQTYDEAWQDYSKIVMDKFEKKLRDRKNQSTNSKATSLS